MISLSLPNKKQNISGATSVLWELNRVALSVVSKTPPQNQADCKRHKLYKDV